MIVFCTGLYLLASLIEMKRGWTVFVAIPLAVLFYHYPLGVFSLILSGNDTSSGMKRRVQMKRLLMVLLLIPALAFGADPKNVMVEVDVSEPDQVHLERFYRDGGASGAFGPHWRHNWERSLVPLPDGTVKTIRP